LSFFAYGSMLPYTRGYYAASTHDVFKTRLRALCAVEGQK
jgi:hypothetical protein